MRQLLPRRPEFFAISVAGGVSSEESAESSEEDVLAAGHRGSVVAAHQHSIRTPITTLLGHQGVVIGCSWLNEDLAVTAGWDRSSPSLISFRLD